MMCYVGTRLNILTRRWWWWRGTSVVKQWSDQVDDDIRDATSDVDWDMFRSSSRDISEFTDVVTSFIATLADTIVPMVKVRSFPNQKPWIDGYIRATLNAHTAAYNSSFVSGNMDEYKAASYGLRRAVKDAKRRYRDRVELQMEQCEQRAYGKGYRSLADNLNSFFAWFEASNNTASGTVAEVSSIARDEHTLSVTEHDVRKALMRVNTRNDAGPDCISGRVLKTCANQLAPVFTTKCNHSLAESVVPACFKWSTIVPVPKTASPA